MLLAVQISCELILSQSRISRKVACAKTGSFAKINSRWSEALKYFSIRTTTMNPNRMLTVTSLLLIVLTLAHLAQDIIYGYEPGNINNLLVVPIAVVWLYGTVVLSGRRSGYIIVLLFSLFSLVVPLVHAQGKGFGLASRMSHTTGHFFFVFSLLAIGVLGVFSVILAACELWRLPWRRQRG